MNILGSLLYLIYGYNLPFLLWNSRIFATFVCMLSEICTLLTERSILKQ